MRSVKEPDKSAMNDTTLHEVNCCECGKPISSIPAWLANATVKFQCEECRQRHPRVPGMADAEPRRTAPDVDELGEAPHAPEETDEDAEGDTAEETDEAE